MEDHYETAIRLHREGRTAEAEREYRAVLARTPRHAGALTGLGVAAIHAGRIAEAADIFHRAAEAAPGDATIRYYCGLTAAKLGRPDDAAEAFAAALALGRAEARQGLADALLALGRYDDARQHFEQVLAAQPGHIPALMGLGDCLAILGRPDEAGAQFRAVLMQAPGHAPALFGLGTVARQQGRIDDARRAFAQAIMLEPREPAWHRALAETARFVPGDARLPALEAMARDETGFSDTQRIELHFALGKAYDDLGRHKDAFAHLEKGNAVRRRAIAYDEDATLGMMRAIAARFTADAMGMRRGSGHASRRPVFVVGMPRSGTSLVEQILASHPCVYGAGETTIVPELLAGGMAEDYPALPSADALARFGAACDARLAALAPDALRVVDKLPLNFRHLGLLHLALPGARFVHVRRDARDTCWSCYARLFLPGLDFAYDLGELGRFYRAYDTLMAHWRKVLPEGTMLDVQYETLVIEPQAEIHRLLDFLGLDRDPRCLAFHETRRNLRTHSDLQVRQPLFRDSIGRWQAYAPWLAPLLAALR